MRYTIDLSGAFEKLDNGPPKNRKYGKDTYKAKANGIRPGSSSSKAGVKVESNSTGAKPAKHRHRRIARSKSANEKAGCTGFLTASHLPAPRESSIEKTWPVPSLAMVLLSLLAHRRSTPQLPTRLWGGSNTPTRRTYALMHGSER